MIFNCSLQWSALTKRSVANSPGKLLSYLKTTYNASQYEHEHRESAQNVSGRETGEDTTQTDAVLSILTTVPCKVAMAGLRVRADHGAETLGH
jgi:hypothetical protein